MFNLNTLGIPVLKLSWLITFLQSFSMMKLMNSKKYELSNYKNNDKLINIKSILVVQ